MSIQSPTVLKPLAQRLVRYGLSEQELEKVVVLKPNITYVDFKKAWSTPVENEERGSGTAELVSKFATRLFRANIIEKSLVT
jgi:hypothetical protein